MRPRRPLSSQLKGDHFIPGQAAAAKAAASASSSPGARGGAGGGAGGGVSGPPRDTGPGARAGPRRRRPPFPPLSSPAGGYVKGGGGRHPPGAGGRPAHPSLAGPRPLRDAGLTAARAVPAVPRARSAARERGGLAGVPHPKLGQHLRFAMLRVNVNCNYTVEVEHVRPPAPPAPPAPSAAVQPGAAGECPVRPLLLLLPSPGHRHPPPTGLQHSDGDQSTRLSTSKVHIKQQL